MSKFPQKFWHWIFKRSPQNAANPNPGTMPYDSGIASGVNNTSQLIEVSTDEIVCLGSTISFGTKKTLARGSTGELIRSRKEISVMGTCGHLIPYKDLQDSKSSSSKNSEEKQTSKKKVGKCYYCETDNLKLVAKGYMTLDEAELGSLVCKDCIESTVSGKLACPNHYREIPDINDKAVYLGPKEQEQLKRKQTIQDFMDRVSFLFCKDYPSEESKGENNNE